MKSKGQATFKQAQTTEQAKKQATAQTQKQEQLQEQAHKQERKQLQVQRQAKEQTLMHERKQVQAQMRGQTQTHKQRQEQAQKQARQSKAPSTHRSAQAGQSAPTKQKAKIASRIERAKAFLIDIFLLYVPVLYVCYFVLGSKEAFLGNQAVIFACSAFFGVVQALFLSTKAQSPGLKAYDLYLIDTKKGRKLSFLRVILRYIAFLIGASLLFGLLMSFLRKDGLALHDLLSQSCIVRKV